MARGWESKSVEDQISERESRRTAPKLPLQTPEELEKKTRREGLMLARTRTLSALQSSCDKRYRAHLERALADLDLQLSKLENSTD